MSGNKSDFEKAISLLSQVIEKSEIDDRIQRRTSFLEGKPSADGDGWITHHLKLIKELLEENKNAEN